MPLPLPTTSSAWVLHANAHLGYAGTLVYPLDNGLECRVPLTPALTTLVLTLIACRALDEREGGTDTPGERSLDDLGRLVGRLPGGNRVALNTIGEYKGKVIGRVKRAIQELSRRTGRVLSVPEPIVHHGHGRGYCLPEAGVTLRGAALDELIRAIEGSQSPR